VILQVIIFQFEQQILSRLSDLVNVMLGKT